MIIYVSPQPIDLETTGLDAQQDHVIELGTILYSVNHHCSLQQLSTLFTVHENSAEMINRISSQASQEAGGGTRIVKRQTV
jgi:oligoribonuclease (3'-5' exoribonuclease)